jgi:hypothetical protein
MFDFLQGKFELRIWLGVLLLVSSLLLTLLGDQATFVHPPRNSLEILLTFLPVFEYYLIEDRSICFIVTMAIYGGALGGLGVGIMQFLEQQIFEPMFFKKMIQTKLREEKLFNQYLDELKP